MIIRKPNLPAYLKKAKRTTKWGKRFIELSISSAIIGLIGATVVPLETAYLSEKNTKYQKEIEVYQQVVSKRLEIIDKASQLMGMNPGIQDIFKQYIDQVSKDKLDTNLSEKLLQYNSQYYSIITQANLYFGPKTREATKELSDIQGPWWAKGTDSWNKLTEAMSAEISFGIPKL